MDDAKIKKLLKKARREVQKKDWAKKTAKKLLPLLIKDIKGTIDLNKDLTEKVPFFSIERDGEGKVVHCVKHQDWDKYCKSCIFTNNCYCN